MSTSPQLINSKKYSSVPWYSADEWKYVYKLIFGPDSTETCKREALKVLLVWKSRFQRLPSGIESTLGLLEVDLQMPIIESNSKIPDRLLRLMYSSVIMRFINHTLDDVTKNKGMTLLQAGPEVNIPQWVVNLRHETAHGHDLPSLNLLKDAANFAMNWLFESYWMPQNNFISNYCVSRNVQSDNIEEEMAEHINTHNLLAVFCYHKFAIKRLSEIPDESIKYGIFSCINECASKPNCKIKMDVKIKDALAISLKIIDKFIQKSKQKKIDECIAKFMLCKESLFLVSDIDESDSKAKDQKLPNEYIGLWKPILTLLHTRNMLMALIKGLLTIVGTETESPERRMRAAQWVKEISIGLYKSSLFASISSGFNCPAPDVIKNSYQLLVHHYPNQKKGLTLNLLRPVPEELSSKKFIYNLMINTSPYMKFYVKEILALSSSKLPESSIQNLCNLVEIVSGKKTGDSSITDEIYTVSDITRESENEEYSGRKELELCKMTDINNLSCVNMDVDLQTEGKWERASVDFEWGKYPVGVLPWQSSMTSMNPTFVPNSECIITN